MERKQIKNWLFISIIFLLLCSYSCKKYRKTVVKGRFVNLPINKGIGSETFVLKAFSQGGFLLPDKAKIEMQTTTDADGNFEFTFDGYYTRQEKKRPTYGVEWVNSHNKKQMVYFSSSNKSNDAVDLTKFYNNDLLSYAHIDNVGKENNVTINVVLGGTLKVLLSNDIEPKSSTDSIEVDFINQFGTFRFGGAVGTNTITLNDGNASSGYFPGLVPGETTIRANIYKNGTKTVKDTSFFVEDKEYYLEYHY